MVRLSHHQSLSLKNIGVKESNIPSFMGLYSDYQINPATVTSELKECICTRGDRNVLVVVVVVVVEGEENMKQPVSLLLRNGVQTKCGYKFFWYMIMMNSSRILQ